MKIKNNDYMVLGLAGVAVFMILKTSGIKMPKLPGLESITKIVPTFASLSPLKPSAGVPYRPVDPGQYIPVDQLINGTVHDFYSGNKEGYGTPLISGIVDDVLNDIYKTKERPGEFMRVPGAYW